MLFIQLNVIKIIAIILIKIYTIDVIIKLVLRLWNGGSFFFHKMKKDNFGSIKTVEKSKLCSVPKV